MKNTQIQEVYIVAAMRTPIGKVHGALSNVNADELLAQNLKAIIAKFPSLDPNVYDEIMIGCALYGKQQNINLIKNAVFLSGLPQNIPGLLINRGNASGLQAIMTAADKIALGRAEAIIAGGVESLSHLTINNFDNDINFKILVGMHENLEQTNKLAINKKKFALISEPGIVADQIAKQWEIKRETQDRFALNSYLQAMTLSVKGYLSKEIVPLTITTDENLQTAPTFEFLNKLRPVYSKYGTATVGNSSQVADAAALVMLVSKNFVKQHGLNVLAKISDHDIYGLPEELFGLGAIHSIPKILEKNKLNLADIAWLEINETFASTALAIIKGLTLDPSLVNQDGGAIALGNPLGVSSVIGLVNMLHGMQRKKLRYGVLATDAGLQISLASIFEAVW